MSDTDEIIELVREATSTAKRTGYQQHIVDRDGRLLVIPVGEQMPGDAVLETCRP